MASNGLISSKVMKSSFVLNVDVAKAGVGMHRQVWENPCPNDSSMKQLRLMMKM